MLNQSIVISGTRGISKLLRVFASGILATLMTLNTNLVLADGNETLGPPSIAIASGTGMVAAGTGLFTQPSNLNISVPVGSTIKQVLIYWEGDVGEDNTITIDGTEVTGVKIGDNTRNTSAFRADITGDGFVTNGPNTLSIGGLNFGNLNYGAGILVIIDDGGSNTIELRDGHDEAYIGSGTTMVPQSLSFLPSTADRSVDLTMFFGEVIPGRPNAIDVIVTGPFPFVPITTTYDNLMNSNDGDQWDTILLSVNVPAGADTVTVEPMSVDNLGVGRTPASVSWNLIGISVPPVPSIATLGDRVWEDLDADGIQDCSDTNNNQIIGDAGDTGPECDSGIPGVPVELFGPGQDGSCNTNDDVSLGMQVITDANGFYSFTNLNPGTYCVDFTLPGDEFCDTGNFQLGSPMFSLADQGGDDAVDSDADPATGRSGNIDLASGDNDLTNDAGIYCPAKVGDRVWVDENENGIQDGGETDMSGVNVNLFECGDDGIAGTADDIDMNQQRTTDSNGMYMFGGEPGVYDLPPGNYYVQFDKPGDYEYTLPKAGGDDAVDSDCMTGGMTVCTGELGSRGINLDRDCGLIPPPPPECALSVDKTCAVVTPPPPPPSGEKCSGRLEQFSVIWTGGPIQISGLPNDSGGSVATNQEVTFFGPFDQNDVYVDITGSVNGQSSFHMSCSDEDFNTPDDCGKFAGDNKGHDSGLINDWLLEGWVDKKGDILDCSELNGSNQEPEFPTADSCAIEGNSAEIIYGYTVTNNGDPVTGIQLSDDQLGDIGSPFDLGNGESMQFTQTALISTTTVNVATASGTLADGAICMASDSVVVEVPPPSQDACESGKPAALLFEYTGDSCAATTNEQNGAVECSGDPAGASPIEVVMTDKRSDEFIVTPAGESVDLNHTFEISTADGGGFLSNTYFDIRQGGQTLQSLRIHTSCSQDLFVGDQFGSVILRGFTAVSK